MLSIREFSEQYVIVKEYFRRRFEESQLVEKIHADRGDVPGVVRIKCYEDVEYHGEKIRCAGYDGGTRRTKTRIGLDDYGDALLSATSVNEILWAFYDILEGTWHELTSVSF